jgi:outer membrane protein assembly factor BamB
LVINFTNLFTFKDKKMKNLFVFAAILTFIACRPTPTPEPTTGLPNPKLVWKAPISNELVGSMCPLVHGDYVLYSRSTVTNITDPLIAFNKNTGTKLWEWDSYGRPAGFRDNKNTYYTHDNTGIFTFGTSAYGIDFKSGKTLWQNRVNEGATAGAKVRGIGSMVFQEKTSQSGSSLLPFLVKCDIKTGQWQTIFTDSLMLNFDQSYTIYDPFIDAKGDTTLFFVNSAYRLPGNPGGEASMSFICSFNVTKNKLNYKKTLFSNKGVSPISGTLYKDQMFLYDMGKILCYDITTGYKKWENSISGYPITVEGNKMFTQTDNKYLRCFDLDTQTETWTATLNSPTNDISNLEFENGIMYFVSNSLYALDMADGKMLWNYDTKASGEKTRGFSAKLFVDKASKRVYVFNNFEALCYEILK